MPTIYFNVYGIKIKLATDLVKFSEFIKENYSLFHTDKKEDIDIHVNISEEAGEYAEQNTSHHHFIGNNIYLSDNSVYWENGFGFHVLVEQHPELLRVNGFHEEFLEDQSPEERYKNFQRCMRFTMHYPLFTLLQYNRDWNLLHGAAARKNDSTVVFCGLNKVGKSTITAHLCQNWGFEIITDNFLLFGNKKIYPFPEVIRLGSRSVEQFGISSLWDHSVYNKHHISPSTLGVAVEDTPDAFFLVSQGQQLTSRKLKPKHAWQCMQNLHSMLGEFPQHGYMAVWPLISSETRNQLDVDTPIFDTPWYSLSYEPNWELDSIVEEVLQCI